MVPGIAADHDRNAKPGLARNRLETIILGRHFSRGRRQPGDHAGDVPVADHLFRLGQIVTVFDARAVPDGGCGAVQHQPGFFGEGHPRQQVARTRLGRQPGILIGVKPPIMVKVGKSPFGSRGPLRRSRGRKCNGCNADPKSACREYPV